MVTRSSGAWRQRWAYEGRIEALLLLARDGLLAVGSLPVAVRTLGVDEADVRQAAVRLQAPKASVGQGRKMPVAPGMKWCVDGHEAPPSAFGKHRNRIDGLQSRCRVHHRKWARDYERQHRATREAAA